MNRTILNTIVTNGNYNNEVNNVRNIIRELDNRVENNIINNQLLLYSTIISNSQENNISKNNQDSILKELK